MKKEKTFIDQLREKSKSELKAITVGGIPCYISRASQSEIQKANAVADADFVDAVRFADLANDRTSEKIIRDNSEAVEARRMLYVIAVFLCDENGQRLYGSRAELQEVVNALVSDKAAVDAIAEYINTTYKIETEEDVEKNLPGSDMEPSSHEQPE